jgi:hypothetical protein
MVAMEVSLTTRLDQLNSAAPVETPERKAPTETPSTTPTRPGPFTPPDPARAPDPAPVIDPDRNRPKCSI